MNSVFNLLTPGADSSAALRHRMTLQIQTDQQESDGNITRTYRDSSIIRCALSPLSSTERTRAESMELTVSHRIFTRFHRDFDASMRLRMASRIFWVRSVRDIEEKHRWTEILADEHTV